VDGDGEGGGEGEGVEEGEGEGDWDRLGKSQFALDEQPSSVRQQSESHPLNRLNLKSNTVALIFGTGPERKLDCTFRDFKEEEIPMSEGRVPAKRLQCKYLRGEKDNQKNTRE
jgi:hypothetical protein